MAEIPAGTAVVPFSRQAISGVIQGVIPAIRVDPQTLTFVPIGNGLTQVNVAMFGPFGVLEAS